MRTLLRSFIAVSLLATFVYADTGDINLSSNLQLNSPRALDARTVTNSSTTRAAIAAINRYDGLTVYQRDTQHTYQLQGGTSTWVDVTPSATALQATGVAFGSSLNTITQDTTTLTWDNTNKLMTSHNPVNQNPFGVPGFSYNVGLTHTPGVTVSQSPGIMFGHSQTPFVQYSSDTAVLQHLDTSPQQSFSFGSWSYPSSLNQVATIVYDTATFHSTFTVTAVSLSGTGAGELNLSEGSSTTITGTGSAHDILWADLGVHSLVFNPNGTSTYTITGASVTVTGGHCAQWLASGALGDAGGACGASGGPGVFTTLSVTSTMTVTGGSTTITAPLSVVAFSTETLSNEYFDASASTVSLGYFFLGSTTGVSGQVITSNGAGTKATWQTPSAGGGGSGGYALQPATVTIQGNKGITASTFTATSTATFVQTTITSTFTITGGSTTITGPVSIIAVTTETIKSEYFDLTLSTAALGYTTMSQPLTAYSRTLVQIGAQVPKAAGEIVYCSNCATDAVCVSTGTGTGAYTRMSARGTACQ